MGGRTATPVKRERVAVGISVVDQDRHRHADVLGVVVAMSSSGVGFRLAPMVMKIPAGAESSDPSLALNTMRSEPAAAGAV